MSRLNKRYGDFGNTIVVLGDVLNIKTWMPRRADLHNYVVVGKPTGPGYEGFLIRKLEGFGGTTATMHIPWQTITHLEVIDHIEGAL